MSQTWEELLAARRNATDPDEQARLAALEHQAWARDYVGQNPLAAPVVAAMVPGYQLAKLLRLKDARTKPSIEQLKSGLTGVGQGLGDAWTRWGKPK